MFTFFYRFIFTITFYLLPFLVKLHTLQSRHPILYFFANFIFVLLFYNCLHLYLDSPLLCMPNPDYDPSLYANVPVELDSSGYNNVRLDSPNPPVVKWETKPHFTPYDSSVELDGVVAQTSTSSSTTPTDNPSTPRAIWAGELGVNYPNTSSVLTQNNSVPSNINELGVNTPNAPTPQPANPLDSLISFYSGADSSNTSLVSERGSITPDRFDANDYPNTRVDDPNTPPNNNHPYAVDIGYLAPRVEESNKYDYTERAIPKVGLLGELRIGFKSFNSKVEGVYVKYNDLTKRKIFWNLWEKNKSEYASYEEFKANWDPNTHILRTIGRELKVDIKEEFKDALGINRGNKGANRGISSEVEKMLRVKRPFNKK